LTSAGKATLNFIPGIGNHSYKAVFIPTTSDATSTSGTATLTVTHSGLYPSTTTLQSIPSSVAGTYTLTSMVGGIGPSAPTGAVSFIDTSNGNSVLSAPTLGTGTAGPNFLSATNVPTGNAPEGIAIGDFNGDGISDLAVTNFDSNTVTVLRIVYGRCRITGWMLGSA